MSALFVAFITADSTVDPNSQVFIYDASSNGITHTLPEASGNDGQNYSFKRQDTVSSNTVTLVGASSGETIDGNVSLTFNPGDKYFIVSWGGVWYTIA